MPGQCLTRVQCRLRGAIRNRHSDTVDLCVSLPNCSIPVPSYGGAQGIMGSRKVRLMPASVPCPAGALGHSVERWVSLV